MYSPARPSASPSVRLLPLALSLSLIAYLSRAPLRPPRPVHRPTPAPAHLSTCVGRRLTTKS
eukprot:13012469-Alexandrium_andersonii.AAC.1